MTFCIPSENLERVEWREAARDEEASEVREGEDDSGKWEGTRS